MELLAPAGNMEKMKMALLYGADAVYMAGKAFGLRAYGGNFTREEMKEAVEYAHSMGKKVYITVNIIPRNEDLGGLDTYLKYLQDIHADAVLISDLGVFDIAREAAPDLPVHVSTQASAANWRTVRRWKDMGASRVVLAREVYLSEMADIRKRVNIELEVFVHGALCIAYSGRCLLSGYFNHRDPNQGTCTNSCRWDYKVHDTETDEMGDVKSLSGFNFQAAQEEANAAFEGINGQQRHPAANKVFLIEESNRPGEMMPIMEDEHGTYIMNSKDLRAIEQVAKLAEIGVDSLKVEGRTKSVYYVARVAQSYRKAIDDAVAGRPFDYSLLAELEGLANRGYTSGFLERHQTQEYQNYLYGHSIAKQSQFVGQIRDVDADGWATVDVKNRFALGDTLEIIHPRGNQLIVLDQMKRKNEFVDVAAGNGIQVQIPNMQGREKALVARVIQSDGSVSVATSGCGG